VRDIIGELTKFIFGTNAILLVNDAIRDLEVRVA